MTLREWLAIGFWCFLLRRHVQHRGFSWCARCERSVFKVAQ